MKGEKKELAIIEPESNSVEMLIARAIDKGTPVETMEKILAMAREVRAEMAKKKFNEAMAFFQSKCPIIEKKKKVMNKDGRTVRYSYAPLETIVEQVKDILMEGGFSYTIDTIVENDWVTAICKVTHKLGHQDTSQFKIPIDKDSFMNQSQKFASALTFVKRYAFCNAFGILTGDEDDDSISSVLQRGQQETTAEQVVKTMKYVCSRCKAIITKEEYDFSKKVFGYHLCKKICQKIAKEKVDISKAQIKSETIETPEEKLPPNICENCRKELQPDNEGGFITCDCKK